MSRIPLAITLGALLLGLSISSYARINITFNAPPDREYSYPPHDHHRCYEVGSEYRNGAWINQHRVCESVRGSRSEVWVSGHWRCDEFNPVSNICYDWQWIPSQTINRYYYEYGYDSRPHHHRHHHRYEDTY